MRLNREHVCYKHLIKTTCVTTGNVRRAKETSATKSKIQRKLVKSALVNSVCLKEYPAKLIIIIDVSIIIMLLLYIDLYIYLYIYLLYFFLLCTEKYIFFYNQFINLLEKKKKNYVDAVIVTFFQIINFNLKTPFNYYFISGISLNLTRKYIFFHTQFLNIHYIYETLLYKFLKLSLYYKINLKLKKAFNLYRL